MIIDREQGKLAFFQNLYEHAKSKQDNSLQQYENQYNGDKTIDGLEEETAYCRNITFELVESQVNSYIPPAKITPAKYSETNTKLATLLQTYLNRLADKLPFEQLNDLDERLTSIYGGSVWLVEWDNMSSSHNTLGDLKVSVIDPKQLIPQPAVYNIRDAEYCFIEFSDTHENLERKYNVTYEQTQETTNAEDTDSDDTCTCIVCFYRDEEGRVCQYIWADDVELSDIEDYWARKEDKCQNCGKRKDDCKCDKPTFVKSNLDYEPITKTMTFFNGLKVIGTETQVLENGMPQFEDEPTPMLMGNTPAYQEAGGVLTPMTMQKPKSKKTKIPFYKPSLFPIVIRRNISEVNNIFGQSDCKFIRDQQQLSNKLESRINEKLINSGVALVKNKKTKIDITSEIYKNGIEVGDPAEAQSLKTLDMQVNTQQDEKRAEKVYQDAKRIIGISDSFQGMPDSTAQSGKAKEIQAMQSGGRLESKRIMKNAAYAEIYEIMFQLSLAFADEPRPVTYKDAMGVESAEEFNKYAFLELDKAGDWYYNDEFLFSTSQVADIQSNREAMWELTKANFQAGAYGNPADIDTLIFYWRNLERLHYPMAPQTIEMLEAKKQQVMAQMQAQQAMQSMQMQNPPRQGVM